MSRKLKTYLLILVALIVSLEIFGQEKDCNIPSYRILTKERATAVLRLDKENELRKVYIDYLDSILINERVRFDSLKIMADSLIEKSREISKTQDIEVSLLNEEVRINDELYQSCSNERSKLKKQNKLLKIVVVGSLTGLILVAI